MLLSELKTMLDAAGYPVAYRAFPEETEITEPYITFEEAGSDNFSADNKVYCRGMEIEITLWSPQKDTEAEEAVEEILDGNDIYWEADETYWEDEKIYEKTYSISLQKG